VAVLLELLKVVPGWFTISRTTRDQVSGVAAIGSDTTVTEKAYDLTILRQGEAVLVRETVPGASLPKVCFDRHIVSDSTFCLGLGMTNSVKDRRSAEVWWASLREYLLIQDVATRTGQWPRLIELDHGMAGIYQQEAIDAAERAGLTEDYRQVLLGESSWINDGRIQVSKDGAHLLNGRLPCPVGCTGRRGRPRLRAECCNRDDITSLVRNEHLRAKELERFWTQLKERPDFKCCGTMTTCPLRPKLASEETAI